MVVRAVRHALGPSPKRRYFAGRVKGWPVGLLCWILIHMPTWLTDKLATRVSADVWACPVFGVSSVVRRVARRCGHVVPTRRQASRSSRDRRRDLVAPLRGVERVRLFGEQRLEEGGVLAHAQRAQRGGRLAGRLADDKAPKQRRREACGRKKNAYRGVWCISPRAVGAC